MKKFAFCFVVMGLMTAGCASKSKSSSSDASAVAKQEASAAAAKAAEAKPVEKAAEAAKAARSAAKVECSHGADKRAIEVVRDGGKACQVLYTKAAKQEQIATANGDSQHCDRVQDKIKAKLEGAGFKCL